MRDVVLWYQNVTGVAVVGFPLHLGPLCANGARPSSKSGRIRFVQFRLHVRSRVSDAFIAQQLSPGTFCFGHKQSDMASATCSCSVVRLQKEPSCVGRRPRVIRQHRVVVTNVSLTEKLKQVFDFGKNERIALIHKMYYGADGTPNKQVTGLPWTA